MTARPERDQDRIELAGAWREAVVIAVILSLAFSVLLVVLGV